jgi:hypothetical protein
MKLSFDHRRRAVLRDEAEFLLAAQCAVEALRRRIAHADGRPLVFGSDEATELCAAFARLVALSSRAHLAVVDSTVRAMTLREELDALEATSAPLCVTCQASFRQSGELLCDACAFDRETPRGSA